MESVVLGALLLLALVILFGAVKIVPQGREYTVERFGRYTRTLKPGMTILTPFMESIGRRLNMMEQVLEESGYERHGNRWTCPAFVAIERHELCL